jgi:4-amino-4-deoxy-L-arabinose transferase-like glycosyltransferase
MLTYLLAILRGLESRRLTGAVIFVIALAVILGAQVVVPERFFQTHDPPDYARFYRPVAYNILDGHGIVTDDGEVAVRYPPGYPLMLAAVYGLGDMLNIAEDTIVMAFIWLCSALVPVMIFYLGRALFNPVAGLLAALLWMTYPFALWLIGQPFTEPPFLVVFLGALWLLWHTLLRHPDRYLNYVIFGLLIGVAMLIRPAAIGLGVIAVIIVWMMRQPPGVTGRLIASGLILIGNLIAVMPWQLYASARTDENVLLSSGGLPSTVFGVMFAVHPSRPYHPSIIGLSDEVLALQQRIYVHDEAGEIETLGAFVRIMAGELRSDPGAMIQLMAIKTARAWYATSSTQQDNLIFMIQVPYLLMAVAAAIVVWRRQQTTVAALLLLVLYLWIITIAALPLLRYMMPAMALLFILIAAMLGAASRKLSWPESPST